jgi:hypothetical protein
MNLEKSSFERRLSPHLRIVTGELLSPLPYYLVYPLVLYAAESFYS